MFSRTPTAPVVDDAHLEVTVTPSASAFYAGETFSAVITLRNTRIPTSGSGHSRPGSSHPSHLHLLPGTKSDGSSAAPQGSPERVWPPDSSAWRGEHLRRPSAGHSRRSQSMALGKGGLSPQEMVRALSGSEAHLQARPPLPPRRTPSIPSAHPHARKISIASSAGFANSPPQPNSDFPDGNDGGGGLVTPSLLHTAYFDTASSPGAGPSRQLSSRTSPRNSPSLPDVVEELSSHDSRRGSTSPVKSPSSPAFSESTSASSPRRSPGPTAWRQHGRSPSYTPSSPSYLTPPPTHPSMRSRSSMEIGTTTVLWAHTRLVARFGPSHQYIPPDPLLPLRARLLHQPIGSGSLASADERANSRWSLSFGTGSIGTSTQPSLTGSLFGLAKGLVTGGTGGSLEEERKRVWSTQDLPVLDTSRSLLGVDIKLAEGETREFVYTIQLPTILPPAFRGRALRFSYELALSLNVALPGGGTRQHNKELTIPIRVWPNVSIGPPTRAYDVLEPIIQNTDEGTITERRSSLPITLIAVQPPVGPPQKPDTLVHYARQLLDSLDDPAGAQPNLLSPSKPATSLSPALSPTNNPAFLSTPTSPRFRPRSTSIVAGDDELVAESQRCGEAVEILSRHSPKASYDIRQDGEVVAVLTLVKTTYRLGETVLGVVTFNDIPDHRVLKLTAYLESREVIPEPLLAPSASSSGRVRQPDLRRNHAESRTTYAQFTNRTAFSLDIPSDATPGFSLSAGEGKRGGLEWRVRIAFLVASGPKRKSVDRRSRDGLSHAKQDAPERPKPKPASSLHLTPTEGDSDNAVYSAASSLVPLIKQPGGWAEAKAATVECEVPVQVLAGNTAFVVRPSVFTL